ncbi:MAG TPA: hypothetical protein VER58_03585 [Thermoanaerobaculia bacterium]|nr:hypothetical protein [Thermoanaerobaculia bacterium]
MASIIGEDAEEEADRQPFVKVSALDARTSPWCRRLLTARLL